MGRYNSGDLHIRAAETNMEAGQKVEGHAHNFGHTTFFNGGKWRVTQKIQAKNSKGEVLMEEIELHLPDGSTKMIEQPVMVPIRTVTVNGNGPKAWLLIEQGIWHEIECLERGIYNCVYCHRSADGEVTTEFTGWGPAYE